MIPLHSRVWEKATWTIDQEVGFGFDPTKLALAKMEMDEPEHDLQMVDVSGEDWTFKCKCGREFAIEGFCYYCGTWKK